MNNTKRKMYRIKNPEETDLYNETMDLLGPEETNGTTSIWQAIPRDIGKTQSPRVMAGSRAILYNLVKPDEKGDINFAMLKDGMPFFPGDPVIQVIGNKSSARKLEPKLLSTLFYMTEIATRAKRWTEALGEERIIDVGMRATPPGAWNYATEALLIGGIKLTASTGIRNIPYLKEGQDYILVGTTGHSLYLEYAAAGYTQKEAFKKILEKFEEKFPGRPCSLLVDTVDSKIGIDDAIEAITNQKRKSGQTHYLRLDSGKEGFGLKEQAVYALEQLLPNVNDTRVIIEDGLTLEKALACDRFIKGQGYDPKKHIIYGAGGAFVNDISRDGNGAWAYKPSLFETTNNRTVAVVKLSSNPLKNSLAGLIGLNYDVKGNRLVEYNKRLPNRIMDKREVLKYMTSSLEDLRAEAKPYWELAKRAPKRWFEKYDLSPKMQKLREEAIARTLVFGNIKRR